MNATPGPVQRTLKSGSAVAAIARMHAKVDKHKADFRSMLQSLQTAVAEVPETCTCPI